MENEKPPAHKPKPTATIVTDGDYWVEDENGKQISPVFWSAFAAENWAADHGYTLS